MARKRILTRMATKRGLPARWRKNYKGERYYFRGEYETAEAEWITKKYEIDNLPIRPPRNILELRKQYPNASEEEFQQIKIQEREIYKLWVLEQRKIYALREIEQEEENRILADYRQAKSEGKTISQQIDRFLLQKQTKVQANGMKPFSCANIGVRLKHFAEFMGGDNNINTITEVRLVDFQAHLIQQANDDKLAWAYAKCIMKDAIQFVKNCWALRQLKECPRNLDQLSIPAPNKEIKLFTKAEYLHLIDNAPNRMKLYLLLMLNIGATQKDISDLKQSEVDWNEGRITRRRSKSQSAGKDTPVVSYKLWKNTFDLLKKLRSKDKTLVLLNNNGTPLRSEKLVDGKLKFSDNIKNDYYRLCKSLGIPEKPMKRIRKTGASKIGEKYPDFVQYYLAHSPRTIAQKSYHKLTPAQFDKAVTWLGRQFFDKP